MKGAKPIRGRLDDGFSLIEVTLAIGVVAFALVAILGVFPAGLQNSLASQNETRAAQFAASVFASMDSQAQAHFTLVKLPLVSGNQTVDLSSSSTTTIYADNDGRISSNGTGATFKITVTANNAPAGFDAGVANAVTVGVAWPANAANGKQTLRNFVRVISKQ